jgi:hypothetical protein
MSEPFWHTTFRGSTVASRIHFESGAPIELLSGGAGMPARVRCVAEGAQVAPIEQHYQRSASVVLDLATGLSWQRNTQAEIVDAARLPTAPRTPDEAALRCSQLELDGESDWRLPTVLELLTLAVPYERYDDAQLEAAPDGIRQYFDPLAFDEAAQRGAAISGRPRRSPRTTTRARTGPWTSRCPACARASSETARAAYAAAMNRERARAGCSHYQTRRSTVNRANSSRRPGPHMTRAAE